LARSGLGVDVDELPARVRDHLCADRHGDLRAAVVGVHRHRPVQADDLRVDGGVGRGGDLDDRVDALGASLRTSATTSCSR
jgi:hypothetical protein